MIKVFRSELYSMVHSRVVWVFIVLMTLFSVFTVSVNANGHSPAERVYFVTGARDAELESSMEQALGANWDKRLWYDEARDEYRMNLDDYKMLKDSEKYRYLFERSDFLHCYEIYPERYSLEEQNIFERWAVVGIFSDISGPIYFCIFFAVFFFGRAWTKRGYTAGILCGRKRKELILGRILVYVLTGVLMSILQTFLAFLLYAPRVPEVYGAAVMVRGFVVRLSIELFFYGLLPVFSVLIRKPFLSFVASFGFVALFFSNRTVIELPIFTLYDKALDCIVTGEGFGAACFPLMAWTAVALAVTGIASALYIGRAELK